jgi:hypothetical protein
MVLLVHAFRSIEPTLARPACSIPSSPEDVVPLVPILVNSPQVLSKRAWIISTISSCFGEVAECSV